MKVKNSIFLGILVAVTCFGSNAFGGAWVRECGEWFFALEGYHSQTAKLWDIAGNKQPANNEYEKWEASLWAEFGFTRCDTITAQIRYADVEDVTGTDSGIDEAHIGWKRLLFSCGDHAISWHSQVVIPGGDTGTAPCWRYGKWGTRSELMYSTGFDWWCGRGFFDVTVGYLNYFGFPSDQITHLSRIGLDFPWCLQLVGWLQLDYGLMNGTEQASSGSDVFGNAKYRLLKGNLAARYKFNGCVDLLLGWQEYLWGQHVGTGGGPYGALWVKF